MAVNLSQAATLSENDLQTGVVETFMQESVVLDRLPMVEINGNAYAYNEEATLPGVEFRAVNAAYAESTGTVNQRTESLVILGGDADVDRFIVQTRGNLNDQRAIQTRMKVKSISYKFQDAFINGDTAVDANSFDGLKKRLIGAQTIAAGANGLPVLGADDAARQSFLDQLDALIAAVPGGPDALYMNAAIRSRILSSLRRLNIYTTPVGRLPENLAPQGTPIPQATLPTYNGIPLIDIGNKADGTLIIPQTETQGTAAGTTSSIYAVKFTEDEGENGVAGLTNGGVAVMDKGLLETKNVYRTSIELYTGVAVFGKGGARLTGVLAA